MTPWCYGTMARWHFCAQSLATALPSRGQIMIEFLDTYAVNDEIPVLGGHQPPLKTSADTEVRRFYHVFACCRATIFEKTSILPVPSQNHGLDGKGVSHHHDTVRLIVIVMKGVGVGVKYRSDTIVATCQDKQYFRGGRGRMMLVAMALTNPSCTSNAKIAKYFFFFTVKEGTYISF